MKCIHSQRVTKSLSPCGVSTKLKTRKNGVSSGLVFCVLGLLISRNQFKFSQRSMLSLMSTVTSIYESNMTDDVTIVRDDVIRGRFSVSLEHTLAERGLNLITPQSGCQLAAWIFQSGPPKFIDCSPARGDELQVGKYHASQRLDPETARQIQPYDTIYVNIKGLTDFVQTILPIINTSIVVLAGQYHNSPRNKIGEKTELSLLNASCVVRLFVHNIDRHFSQSNHSKFGPWPFGVQPGPYAPTQPNPIEFYTRAFWKHLNGTSNIKKRGVMRGYISPYTNPNRVGIPSGPKLNHTEYYDELARHRFILSPDGDRPECYRTYEAIGLGTIPITELSMDLYPHLQPAPVLYQTSDWNLSESQAMGRLRTAIFPTVNRMMVLEEYWMDYVQRKVGRNDLRWFDSKALKKAKLDDFQVLTETGSQPI